MLGTGFLISNEGKVVTARHVVGNETNDLCVLLPHIPNINVYQDVTDLSCHPATAIIEDINPITDLCILKTDLGFNGNLPPLESLDNIPVGENWYVWISTLCYGQKSTDISRNRNWS